MKFYYRGRLIRTSKTHTYNWAVVEEREDGSLKVYGCRMGRHAANIEASHWVRRGHLGVQVVALDTEPQPAALTYDELMNLARENYDKGGDGYVECWDERTFAYFVREFGPITRARALEMFAAAFDEEKEERAAAQAAVKGEI